ncbi:MAG: glutamate--tRNA ligase [Rickettsiaceae bacterium]
MNKVITRFAPSPTGHLHVGNIRTALINWVYAKHHSGICYLRFDDTDKLRNKQEYKDSILNDLSWLELIPDQIFAQSTRLDKYNEAMQYLISIGRLYPCFESTQELDLKRKWQISNGKPPMYDRSALKLSEAQIQDLIDQGKKPHYRFLIKDESVIWNDLVKGEVHYQGKHLNDPIIVRQDGSMTYMLCSTVDDIEYGITDVIRGEDHVTNTAIQIQMFQAMYGAQPPNFGHIGLIKSKEEKISKRIGGFEISQLRDSLGLEPMAINSLLCLIGSSKSMKYFKNMQDLVADFNIESLSNSTVLYCQKDLEQLNHKLLIHLDFDQVKDKIYAMGLNEIDEQFWLAVRPNLQKLSEIKIWWKACHEPNKLGIQDKDLLNIAAKLFPNGTIDENTWKIWTTIISRETGKSGKDLFLPLRIALTGMQHGPELKNILPLLSKEEIISRLIR